MTSRKKILIIAEIGVNHNGQMKIAKKLILAAKKSGADVVKFQNFSAEKLVTKNAKKAPYQIRNTKNKKSQLEMLKKLELKKKNYFSLIKFCKAKNIKFLSSVFDPESIDFLYRNLNINTIKIPSGEITNPLILNKLNLRKHTVILSTGMSNMKEIILAINTIAKKQIYKINKNKIIITNSKKLRFIKRKLKILHCVTDYPVKNRFANLQCINTMLNDLKIEVGYSDHTKGIIAPLIAVSKGAKIIEKHFTLNKKMSGPDHSASLDPKEFKKMVDSIRTYEIMNGDGIKRMLECEKINRKIVRKSLVASKNIKKGERFTHKNITTKRPGYGTPAFNIHSFINKISKKNYKMDDLI